LREPRPQAVGLRAWRVFQEIPRQAWTTARQIVEELGDPTLTSFDVAGAIRAKLMPLYMKRRPDPDDRGINPRRYQYQRLRPPPQRCVTVIYVALRKGPLGPLVNGALR